MLVGVPKETKDNEFRVSVIPATVEELVRRGHQVLVEAGAGSGAGLADAAYESAGAEIAGTAEAVFERAELIVKVKEPLQAERRRLKRGQVLFTYLHLAADLKQADELMASGVTAIAYETVTGPGGTLPLLMPMSEVAGRMAPQVGAYCLEKVTGGRGVLLGGVPGVPPGDVLILGSGVVGTNAALIAIGLGADVIMAGHNMDQLRQASARFGSRLRTVFSTRASVETLCRRADLVIGAVLVPGAAAPKLISAETVKAMKPGAVIVDVAIDQGGISETSRPTTHSHPTYIVDEVVHYCVTNMPGAVARTSTFALSNVTAPFVMAIADKGYARALMEDHHLRDGLNVHDGQVAHKAVADALDLPYMPASKP
ncbi:MAG TPA: alanine dehydrogenase [Methyloceanibacter sp.]|nr:alanine dehydrogenase [Methyloceanibacter sp.]